jgi:hypothetical protein
MWTNQSPTEISETKDSTVAPGQRRSRRVILDVPLAIRGEAEDQRPFQEETFTITVSAHGALVVLEKKVRLGQKVVLMNPKNWDEREGTITFLGLCYAGLWKVGIQFTQPSPEFWLISSPPSDWNLS